MWPRRCELKTIDRTKRFWHNGQVMAHILQSDVSGVISILSLGSIGLAILFKQGRTKHIGGSITQKSTRIFGGGKL